MSHLVTIRVDAADLFHATNALLAPNVPLHPAGDLTDAITALTHATTRPGLVTVTLARRQIEAVVHALTADGADLDPATSRFVQAVSDTIAPVDPAKTLADLEMRFDVAVEMYRTGARESARVAVLALCHLTRAAHPDAAHLRLEASDQGDWCVVDAIILADGTEITDLDGDLYDSLDRYASSLDTGTWTEWQAFTTTPQGRRADCWWLLSLDTAVAVDADPSRLAPTL